MESIAETDEELLDKYLNDGELSDEDIYSGLVKGCAQGDIAPVYVEVLLRLVGIKSFIDNIVKCFPSPEYSLSQKAKNSSNGEEVFIKVGDDKPFSAIGI